MSSRPEICITNLLPFYIVPSKLYFQHQFSHDLGSPPASTRISTDPALPSSLHPIYIKADDLPSVALMESYRLMVENHYPDGRVFLSPLPLAMSYAGPKAEVLLAIIRKKSGCTHFIVGRVPKIAWWFSSEPHGRPQISG